MYLAKIRRVGDVDFERLRVEVLIEDVKILSAVVNVQTLKDTELVAGCSCFRFGNVVLDLTMHLLDAFFGVYLVGHTSCAFSCNINIANTRVGVWEPRKLRNERLRSVKTETSLQLSPSFRLQSPLAQSRSRGHVVDVFLDVGRNVVFFGRDIMFPGSVLPKVELSEQEFFNFGCSRIELDPLSSSR
jgi:hypothetical protein